MANAAAFCPSAADSWSVANIVALLGDSVAGFIVFAVVISRTAFDALTASFCVGVSDEATGTGALEAARKILADGAVAAGSSAVQAFVDVFAFTRHANIALTAVEILVALGHGDEVAA